MAARNDACPLVSGGKWITWYCRLGRGAMRLPNRPRAALAWWWAGPFAGVRLPMSIPIEAVDDLGAPAEGGMRLGPRLPALIGWRMSRVATGRSQKDCASAMPCGCTSLGHAGERMRGRQHSGRKAPSAMLPSQLRCTTCARPRSRVLVTHSLADALHRSALGFIVSRTPREFICADVTHGA